MNAFVCLGLEPQPWLDPGVVRAAQQAILARAHPDLAMGDEQASREANEAARRLASPSLVLNHYLECHGQAPGAAVQAVPSDLAEVFMDLAGPMGEASEILRAGESCESFLERAALTERVLAVMPKLRAQLESVVGRQEVIHQRIRQTAANGPTNWDELRRCAMALAFLERWARDAEERLFQLADLAAG